jgi:hypothetical protein
MARIRTIKPEFFSHEKLAGKSAHARLLAIGLLTIADCEGRLRWVPMQIHAQVFPWEAEVKIQVLLQELIECDYVIHYEVDGKRYVEVVNFAKHQRLSGKEAQYKSRLPAKPPIPAGSEESPENSGEEPGKQACASPGSDGEPLGTDGTDGTDGTGEQGNHTKPPKAEVEKPDDIDRQAWEDWRATRKSKRAGPITQTAMDLIRREASAAGIGLQEAVALAAGSGWITFKAEYMRSRGSPAQTTFAQQRVANTRSAIEEFCDG